MEGVNKFNSLRASGRILILLKGILRKIRKMSTFRKQLRVPTVCGGNFGVHF